MPNATLGDLGDRLLDQKGPLQNHFCSPILNFYTETSRELRPHMQVAQLGEEFYIHESAAGIWLEKTPDTGKFLEAMRYSKFRPASPNFEIKWTAKTVPTVPPREALSMVKEVLHGTPADAESECRFVRIFGKLTAWMESWNLFNLQLLQLQHFKGLERFKHFICQHYVDLARSLATSMVTTDRRLPPIIGYVFMGCHVFGYDWPWPISEDPDMQHHLQVAFQVHPGLEWQCVSRALRFWEWGVDPIDDEEPKEFHEFQKLKPDERLQMLHVQLRLSCCNVAEVQGPLNELCAKILAELLGYELKVLKYENSTDFDTAIEGFDREIEEVEIEPRKFLVLVTNLPATCRGNFFGQHRMILCYNPAMEPPAKRPRY
eukprot:Skav230275  [mRNA]  locus=scaffold3387:549853:550974:- [translate_table: standard]